MKVGCDDIMSSLDLSFEVMATAFEASCRIGCVGKFVEPPENLIHGQLLKILLKRRSSCSVQSPEIIAVSLGAAFASFWGFVGNRLLEVSP